MQYYSYYDDPFLSTLPEDIYINLPDVIYLEPEVNYTPVEIELDDVDEDGSTTDEEYEGRVLLTGPFSCPSLKFVLDHVDKYGVKTTERKFKETIYPWVKKCPQYRNKYYKILKKHF